MKLEHELLKMQQDRQREESERAERQRRKDREFQLKMVSMMYGQQHHLNSAMFSSDQHYASSGYSEFIIDARISVNPSIMYTSRPAKHRYP